MILKEIRQEYDMLQHNFEGAQKQFSELKRQTAALEAEIKDVSRDRKEALKV